ncbi:19752_t:CDS:10 [Rhizophagus irregularis]|nr:19752_t:CDS:10 [Rhizophagus irregularis]
MMVQMFNVLHDRQIAQKLKYDQQQFKIYYTCETWRCHNYDEPLKYYHDQFNQAELKRKNLIVSKKLGSKFSEKPHPKAIYTSRSLNSYISKCSSIFTNCSSINFSSNDYISKEFELGIGIESELNVLGTKRNIEELNINSYENNVEKLMRPLNDVARIGIQNFHLKHSLVLIHLQNYVDGAEIEVGIIPCENIRESAKSESRGESVANRSKVEKNWRILDEAIVISYSVFRLVTRPEENLKSLELKC